MNGAELPCGSILKVEPAQSKTTSSSTNTNNNNNGSTMDVIPLTKPTEEPPLSLGNGNENPALPVTSEQADRDGDDDELDEFFSSL